MIIACPKHDPGCRDLFGKIPAKIAAHRGEEMRNLKRVPNDKGLVTGGTDEYPVTDHLFEITCSYKIADHKRNFVLIIEDMQYGYETYIKYRVPHVKALVDEFRR